MFIMEIFLTKVESRGVNAGWWWYKCMTTTMKPSGGGTWCSKEIFMKNVNFEISENPFVHYI